MNISNGHNGAQGHALPEKHNSGAFAYGLSEDGFGKLARARKACDMLQLLFSEYRRAERWMQDVRQASPR